MVQVRNALIVDLDTKVQNALEAAWGQPINLMNRVNIGRGRKHLHRFDILHPDGSALPTSIVVKEAQLWEGDVYDPAASTGAVVQLCNDWAALDFLRSVFQDEPLSPALYAGNRDDGFIVMEDLGGNDPIDALQGNDVGFATAQLYAMARTLGRMHAKTVGLDRQYQQRRDALGQRTGTTDIHGYHYGYGWLHTALNPVLETLALSLSTAVQTELASLVDHLEHPGPFLTFTHGDPCPDNFVYQDGVAFLLDFERGAFRHVCLDAVYGRMVFPTCWCANQVPKAVWQQMESIHRAEFALGCPAAKDDIRYFQGIVAACAYWTLLMFQRYELPTLVHQDSQWGLATLRQRVLTRTRRFVEVSEAHGMLPALGGLMATINEQLAIRWPSDEPELTTFTVFNQGYPKQTAHL